jgi:hypothetical protein
MQTGSAADQRRTCPKTVEDRGAAYVSLPLVAVVLYVALRHLSPLLFEPLSPQELFHRPRGLEDLPRSIAILGGLVGFATSEYPRRFVAATGDYPDRITWLSSRSWESPSNGSPGEGRPPCGEPRSR